MEDELEETQTDDMSLRASPEPLDGQTAAASADDDAEPLEVSLESSLCNSTRQIADRIRIITPQWEDSDNEEPPTMPNS
jgi:hypothetical protein